MPYTVKLERPAQRSLDRLHGATFNRIVSALQSLVNEPRPPGVKKLQGNTNLYRIRVGDWRIVYTIGDRELLVLVVRIANRRDAYR